VKGLGDNRLACLRRGIDPAGERHAKVLDIVKELESYGAEVTRACLRDGIAIIHAFR
jgi:hypothetical protein